MVKWLIYNLVHETTNDYSGDVPAPPVKIEIIRDFSNDVRIKCGELYPTCIASPPTCNIEEMKGYNKCVGAVDLAQYSHDEKQAGTFNQEDYDALKSRIDNTDACLTNSTCTPNDAKNDIDQRNNDVNTNSENKQTETTCDPGFVYNPDTKKCVAIEECAIRNPFGGCILSKGTAGYLVIGAMLLLGGFVLTAVPKPKGK